MWSGRQAAANGLVDELGGMAEAFAAAKRAVDLPEDEPVDSGDAEIAILGMGGVKILRALGYSNIERFHMNEGHAGLLTLELLDERRTESGQAAVTDEMVEVAYGCPVDLVAHGHPHRVLPPHDAAGGP